MIDRDVIEGIHYKKTTVQQINQWEKDEQTLFVRSEIDKVAASRGMSFGGNMGSSMGSMNAGKLCVRLDEVQEIRSKFKV